MNYDPETGELYAPFFRSGFNYDRDAASAAAGLDCSCDGPGKAQQQFAEEVDINTIVRRFGLTGQLPQEGLAPTFADFADVTDYHTAATALRRAEEAFAALPGDVRYRFHNNPQEFVVFCSDRANLDEMRKMGLAHPAPPAPPAPTPPPAPVA